MTCISDKKMLHANKNSHTQLHFQKIKKKKMYKFSKSKYKKNYKKIDFGFLQITCVTHINAPHHNYAVKLYITLINII